MHKMIKAAGIAGALAAFAALPAAAQVGVGSGLVVVNIGDVSPEIAKNINVDVSQIPVTVQVPVGVAATVCGVDANVLAQQKKGDSPVTCTAKNTSTALDQAVMRQVKGQKAGG
jgi:hypothetical protein